MERLPFDSLTPSERKVLRLVDHNRKTEVIAAELRLSPHTVNQHVAAARRKLGNPSRYEAADRLRAFEAADQPRAFAVPDPPSGFEPYPQRLGSMPLGIDEDDPMGLISPHPDPIPDGATAVHERPSPMDYTGWGGGPPDRGAPSDASQLTQNLASIGAGAFKIVVFLLCTMAVAEMLQRVARSNPHLFPF